MSGKADRVEHHHGLTAGPVLDELELGPGTRLVDLGCGNGWAARRAAARGCRAIGIDVSPAMLRTARGHARMDLALASLEALPFASDTFDVAFSMEAIYYAADLGRALSEVARVLRPGGEAHLVLDLYEENPVSHTWSADVGLPMHLLSMDAWREALARTGLREVQASQITSDHPDAEPWQRDPGSLHLNGRKPTADAA